MEENKEILALLERRMTEAEKQFAQEARRIFWPYGRDLFEFGTAVGGK